MSDLKSNVSAKVLEVDQIWNPADAPGSEAALRGLLLEEAGRTGADRCALIDLHCLIGRAEGVQGKFAQARASLEIAQGLLTELSTVCPVTARMRWLVERGRLHIMEATPSQAQRLFSEAWTLALKSAEDSFAVEIAQLFAVTEPLKSQTEWILRAIQIAENSPQQNCKRWLGGLYTSLGWKLFEVRQYERSIELFRKALEQHRAHGTAREAFVAQWAVGKVLRALGKTEDALAIQKTLLAGLGIGGERDGRLYEELAECLQTLKRTTEAQLYFELAYRELSTDAWVKDNQPQALSRMKELGKVK